MHFSARNGWRFVRIALGRTGRAIERSGRRAFRQSRRRRPTGHGDGVLSLSGGRHGNLRTKQKHSKWWGKSGESRDHQHTGGQHVTRRDARARPAARGGEDVVGTRVLRSQTRVSCLGGVPRVACVAFVVVVGTDDE